MSEGGDEKKAYGTFRQHQPPSMGFPQPAPPPGMSGGAGSPTYYPPPSPYPPHGYHVVHGVSGPTGSPIYPPPPHQGYQAVAGYAVVEGTPVRERRLPCCGLGFGWVLFFLGFLLGGIPWYAGAVIILFARVDHREKPGYVACTIAAVLATIAIVFGVTKGAVDDW